VVARLEAKALHGDARLLLPVDEQRPRLVVEQHPARVVAPGRGEPLAVGEEGPAQTVLREHVGAAAEHEDRDVGEGVEQLVQPGPQPLHGPCPSLRRRRAQPDEVGEVGPARGVERERPADRVDDRRRRRDATTLLEPSVVVGRHPGEERDLLAAQPRHAARPAVGGQARTGRVALAPCAAQEVRQLRVPLRHPPILDARPAERAVEGRTRSPRSRRPRTGRAWCGPPRGSLGQESGHVGTPCRPRPTEGVLMTYPTDRPATWFVTGTSRRLGLELVRQLLDRGENVAATTRSTERLLGALAGTDTSRLLALPVDLADEAQVTQAVAAATDRFGGIDVVVNNAGYGFLAAVEEVSDAEARAMFDVQVFGVWNVLRAVLPGLRARRSGHVINVSSVLGLLSFPGWSLYPAGKFAVEAITEALAGEVAEHGISV